MKFAIRNRWNASIIFEAEIECGADDSEGAKLGLAVKAAVKARADLADADLADADLADAYLAGANLARANLAGADLAGAYLAGANLAGANLAGANLARANLARANLADAYLADAYLAGANLAGANLAGADLADANLRSFKADMWLTLAQNRAEVSGLIKALREGRVDGSQYEGECACLVGTIANVKGTSYAALDYDSDNPAERWFMMIRKGDKPGDDTGGGFAAQKALEWAEEFCTVHGIELDQPRGLSAADAPCAEGVNHKARPPNDP